MAREPFATRFAKRVLGARWIVIVMSVLVVAVATMGVTQLEFSANYRIFFDEDNPQLLGLEALENTYGKNENVVFLIVPDDGDATSEDALTAAAWLTKAAWNTPFSRRVDSLANFQYTTADGDDLYVRDLVDPQELSDAEARAHIRDIALSDPRIAGSILGLNGDVSVVNVTVELPEDGLLEAVADVAEFAKALAAEVEERFPGMDLRVVGTVMVNQTFLEASVSSQMIFLPASLLLMALILGVLTRSWAGVVGTGIVIVFSILGSVGLGVWLGLPFSPPVAPAPTIVLMIVVANCVHLLVALQQRLRAGDSRRDAIVEAVRLNLHPVFLASLTTTLGFLSMNFSEVPPYRDLGNFVAIGIVASFILSVTFMPAVLSLLPLRAPRDRRLLPAMLSLLPFRAARERRLRLPQTSVLADNVLRHRKALFLGWVVFVLAMAAAIPRNELNDVLVHFFDEGVEFRQDTDFMDEHLSGNTLLEYSLEAHAEGGATDPLFLADVSNFAEWYHEQAPVRHARVGIGGDAIVARAARSERARRGVAKGKRAACSQRQQHRPRGAVRLHRAAQHPRHVDRDPGRAPGNFCHSPLRFPIAQAGPDQHHPQSGSRRAGLRRLGFGGRAGGTLALRGRGHDRRHCRGRHGAFSQQVPTCTAGTGPEPRRSGALFL